MLGLRLREEFRRPRANAAAVELKNGRRTGATQIRSEDFLGFTYPSLPVLTALSSLAEGDHDDGRPVVLVGGWGTGKSHLLATMHHCYSAPRAVRSWLDGWAPHLGAGPHACPDEARCVISESLHRQRHGTLWGLILEHHPAGPASREPWSNGPDEVPSLDLLVELFEQAPTALILDELQTWYEGLTDTKAHKRRTWAFNCLQLLCDIARDRPDLLVLVASVRSPDNDAFRQIQRVGPALIDLDSMWARADRRQMILHRLFENRRELPEQAIADLVAAPVAEHARLFEIDGLAQPELEARYVETWPFSPSLIELIEANLLGSGAGQQSRDLLRLLASIWKGNTSRPILTAAHMSLGQGPGCGTSMRDGRRKQGKGDGVAELVGLATTSPAGRLLERARKDIRSMREAWSEAGLAAAHLEQVMAALWLRSLQPRARSRGTDVVGALPEELQVDLTAEAAIDDNAFHVELTTIVDHSLSIHDDGTRVALTDRESSRARLIHGARDDRLFQDGSDARLLAREVGRVVGSLVGREPGSQGTDVASKAARVVVLPEAWDEAPFGAPGPAGRPQPGDWEGRPPVIVVPEAPPRLEACIGRWLREHLQGQRNLPRFVVPRESVGNIYRDQELIFLARAAELSRRPGGSDDRGESYLTRLATALRQVFDRFAVLKTWSYREPEAATFHLSYLSDLDSTGRASTIDGFVEAHLFVPEDLESLVVAAAESGLAVADLLRDLREPRPRGEPCIPWLGQQAMVRRIRELADRGLVEVAHQAPDGGETGSATASSLEHSSLRRSAKPRPTARAEARAQGEPTKVCQRGPLQAQATGLELLAQVEAWRIGSRSQLARASLEIEALSGSQLVELLSYLPDGLCCSLEVVLKKADP